MRKYRYGDPTKGGFFKRYGTFMYFFAAWNLIGFVAWKVMNVKKSEEDKNWDEKPANEKYLSLIGYGQREDDKKITQVKIHGLQIESSKEEKTPE